MNDPHPGGLLSPIPPPLQRLLRRAVLEHIDANRGLKVNGARLHVGIPGGTHLALSIGTESTDHALRTDLVGAMLAEVTARTGPWTPLVWVTRSGALTASEDVDVAWLAAARSAFAEVDRKLTYVLVNRTGWRDPRSGLERQWHRLRAR